MTNIQDAITVLQHTIDVLRDEAPTRTLTARQIINKAVLQLEQHQRDLQGATIQ